MEPPNNYACSFSLCTRAVGKDLDCMLQVGNRIIFKSGGTLRNLLTKVKFKTPKWKKKGVVYKVPCRDCEACYVGETRRSVYTEENH